MRTIYCIAYTDQAGKGVNQFDTAEDRANAIGKSGGVDEVLFEVNVPIGADEDDVEAAIDAALAIERRPKGAVNEYMFDVKLMASIRISARNRKEAEKALRSDLDSASCNAGAHSNGDPLIFEASIDGELDLIEVNGEPAN